MKKSDPRWDDTSITHSCGNVFLDMGFKAEEAKELSRHAQLMSDIRTLVTQPDVKLTKEQKAEFSSLMETAHLLRSRKNAERMFRALKRARTKKVKTSSVVELRRNVELEISK